MTDERDPYRSTSSAYHACPRCGDALLISGTSFVCGRDCGEWIELGSLRTLEADLTSVLDPRTDDPAASRRRTGTTSEFPLSAFHCPICKRQMESRAWGNALFELCAQHGIWLAARFRSAFHLRVAAAIEDEREIRAFADRLDLTDPAARRELARRLLLLERRVRELSRRAAATDDG